MIDNFDELSILVASGSTIRAAAKQLQISEQTAYRISEKPAFRTRVNELRSQALSAAVGRLSVLVSDAVECLSSIMANGSDRDKLTAAKTVLAAIAPLTELAELRHRIAALESQGGLKIHG